MTALATKTTYEYITTEEALKKCAEDLYKYKECVKVPKFCIDLETYSTCGRSPEPILRPDGTYEGYIRLIQIGLDPMVIDKQYLIDVKKLGEELVIKYLKELLESTILINQNIGYDWGFLFKQLRVFNRRLQCTMLMNQVLRAGDQLAKHDLISLCIQHIPQGLFQEITGLTFLQYKDFKTKYQTTDWGVDELDQAHLKYAANDARLPFYILRSQFEELDRLIKHHDKLGISSVIKDEWGCIPIFRLMKINGIGYNQDYVNDIMVPFLEDKKKEALESVGQHFSQTVEKKKTEWVFDAKGKRHRGGTKKWTETIPINPQSSQQVIQVLKEFCPGIEYEKTGKTVLFKHIHSHPAIRHILDFRKANKMLSTYGANMFKFVHEDGRIHADTFQIGQDDKAVSTGRSSGAKPNLMNQPSRPIFGKNGKKFARSPFTPKEGYVFVCADAGNLEARLITQDTKDEILVRAFSNDEDVYAITAKGTLNLDYLPVKDGKGSEERDFGKQTFLALQYGMGIARYIDNTCKETEGEIVMDWDLAKERRTRFFQTYSGLANAIESIRNKVARIAETHTSLIDFKARKPIYTQFTFKGRPRQWFLTPEQELLIKDEEKHHLLRKNYKASGNSTFGNEFNNRFGDIVREAFNSRIQGTAADIIKEALILIFDKFIEFGFDLNTEFIVITVHDEILAEVKEEHGELTKEIIYDSLMTVLRKYIKKIPVKVDIGIGKTWADAK